MNARTRYASTPVMPGLVAGALGALTIDVYLLIVVVAVERAASITTFYQFVASSLIGRDAYGSPNFAWLGLALHVAASLAWGVGYAYVAARLPQLKMRPIVSGTVYGLVVMIAMQLVEVAANIYTLPTSLTLLNAIVAHTIFFGIPVAIVVSKRLEPSPA